MKPKLALWLRILVSVGLVAVLLWSMRGHLPYICVTLAKTNLFLFSAAVLLFVTATILIAFRLRLVFLGEGLRIAFGRVIQLTFIGYFFNNFMPTAVGGDIVKAHYAHKETGKTAKSFVSVFMDRFIGLFSFVALGVLALLVSWESIDPYLRKIVLAFALLAIIVLLSVLNRVIARFVLNALSRFKLWNMGEKLSKIYRAVHEYRNKKMLILTAMGVSLVSQSLYFLTVYLLNRSLGTNLPLNAVFLIMPIVSVISMMPSLGGLGLQEGAIVVLFGPSIGNDNAFSVSILLRVVLLLVGLIGAAIYVSAAQFRIQKETISSLKTHSV